MNVYVSWIKEEEKFNINTHCTNQTALLSIEIIQKEGEAAKALLEVPGVEWIPEGHRWAWICVERDHEIIPLFLGSWSGTPYYKSRHVVIITMLSLSRRWQDQMRQCIAQLPNGTIEFEGLESDQPLESWPYIWHFHPATLQVELTHLFHGTSHLTITSDDIIEESFHQSSICQPYEKIHVDVSAEWVQELEGTINLFPVIAQLFPGHMINTLTPDAFIRNWPKAGNWLKRSGYFIYRSDISIISPPMTGGLDLYPRLTKTIKFEGKDHCFERFWLTGVLDVGWQYRQKRRQKVSFAVRHHHQFVEQRGGLTKRLTLKIHQVDRHLAHKGCSDFFQSSYGQEALLKAMRCAQCHLAASARNLRFRWQQPFSRLVTLNQEVHFQHPYTKSRFQGKLVGYRHVFNAQGWVTELTVAVAAGIDEINLPEGVKLTTCNAAEGLVNAESFSPIDFIEHINVHNGPDEQLQHIEMSGSCDVPTTQIECSLKDLRSKSCLEQTFVLDDELIWSAPNQLCFVNE